MLVAQCDVTRFQLKYEAMCNIKSLAQDNWNVVSVDPNTYLLSLCISDLASNKLSALLHKLCAVQLLHYYEYVYMYAPLISQLIRQT